ncbi:hypothetical protein HAZT_HAZT008049 [Hyalella azteca]|uniref:Uncharacterized protein n=1 Tax=Hyalella azteca TaxID=294128 RepID=A0A6A0H5M4_HYAAZ|nr:hypothetical protein HAZT_HAZT008049 [Hyalella azteca]
MGGRCPPASFACHTGRCVPLAWLCDDTDDCGDRSDELHHTCAPPHTMLALYFVCCVMEKFMGVYKS